MRLFDVLGPVMTGPSSSHTAGACALAARRGVFWASSLPRPRSCSMAALPPQAVATARIVRWWQACWACSPMMTASPTALHWPRRPVCTLRSAPPTCGGAHPNTAMLRLVGVSGRKLEVVGSSIGGGRINICQIDGITTNFGGDHNTLIVHNQDTPGHVAAVTTCLSRHGVNIATMQLYRSAAGGYAVMVLECDEPIPDEIAGELRILPGIVKVTILNL